jgi:hypothetical protein
MLSEPDADHQDLVREKIRVLIPTERPSDRGDGGQVMGVKK